MALPPMALPPMALPPMALPPMALPPMAPPPMAPPPMAPPPMALPPAALPPNALVPPPTVSGDGCSPDTAVLKPSCVFVRVVELFFVCLPFLLSFSVVELRKYSGLTVHDLFLCDSPDRKCPFAGLWLLLLHSKDMKSQQNTIQAKSDQMSSIIRCWSSIPDRSLSRESTAASMRSRLRGHVVHGHWLGQVNGHGEWRGGGHNRHRDRG